MKVLVATASKHGSTKEIGDAISKSLEACGIDVNVEDISEVKKLSHYDAVVLGSAVYAGNWLPKAKKFVQKNTTVLSKKPTWIFSSGPLGNPLLPNEANAVQLKQIFKLTNARDHKLFAGKLLKKNLGLIERTIVKSLRVQEGDFRNWHEIDNWATNIGNELTKTGAQS